MGLSERPSLLRHTGELRRGLSKKCPAVGNSKPRDLVCRSAAPCACRYSKDRVVTLSQSVFDPHPACVQVAHELWCAQPDITGSLSSNGSDGEIESSKDPVIQQGHVRQKGQRLNLSLKNSRSSPPLSGPKRGARGDRATKCKGSAYAVFC